MKEVKQFPEPKSKKKIKIKPSNINLSKNTSFFLNFKYQITPKPKSHKKFLVLYKTIPIIPIKTIPKILKDKSLSLEIY